MTVSPDGKLLAADTWAGTTQLWDLASRTQRATLPAGSADAAETVAFSADGKYLATGTLPSVRLLDVGPDSVVSSAVASLPVGQAESVWSLAFDRTGRSLAVGTTGGTQLWDVTSQTLTGMLPVGTGTRVNALAFSPSGGILAAGSDRGTIQLWDFASPGPTPTPTVTLRVGTGNAIVNSVAFSPSGRFLAAGAQDGTVEAWTCVPPSDPDCHVVPRQEQPGRLGGVQPRWQHPSRGARRRHRIRLWRVTAQALSPAGMLPVGGHLGVYSIAFRPTGTILAAATANGTIQLWDVAARRQVTKPILAAKTYPALAFSRDGTTLIIGSAAGIQLWDTGTERQVGVLPGNSTNNFFRGALITLSPGGTLLAIGTGPGTVQLWSMPYLTDLVGYLCGLAGQPFPAPQWASHAPGLPYQATCP